MKIYKEDKSIFHSSGHGDFLSTVPSIDINGRPHWKLQDLVKELQEYIDNHPNVTNILVRIDGDYDWSEMRCVLERDETREEQIARVNKEAQEKEDRKQKRLKEIERMQKKLKELEKDVE